MVQIYPQPTHPYRMVMIWADASLEMVWFGQMRGRGRGDETRRIFLFYLFCILSLFFLCVVVTLPDC